jgi:uncharacterized membrane protein YphA (DoxX/SURF4 family)
MKTLKITYWVSTGIVTLMMTYSAYAYLTQPAITVAFKHLGYPDYFRIELAVAKLLGAIFLLIPAAARIKEWAYAGFLFTFISAFIAHNASGDPIANRITPLVFLIFWAVSYITYHKINQPALKLEAATTKSPAL